MEADKEAEIELDLRTPDVMNKYQGAADIVNQALAAVIAATVPGKLVSELCDIGDNTINQALSTVFTKGKIDKGIAFPTCVSINNCVGHFSPLAGDPKAVEEGDVVKIDLGVHVDGFSVSGAHTVIASANPTEVVTGRKADVICAAHFAAECALRLFRPGGTNQDITAVIQKVADVFKCSPVEGVLSHQTKRFVMDGGSVILNKETPEHQVDDVTFAEYDVFCFDIIMSTGEGKPKEKDIKTTVFKRAVEQNYNLKMQTARQTFGEINRKFPTMPFSLRAFQDPKRARLAMTEILKHELVDPFPVLWEKDGEYVAQFKFTALLTPAQTLKLVSQGLPFVKSDYTITDPALTALLAQGTKRGAKKKANKKRKGKKKAAAPAAEGVAEAAAPAAAEEKKAE